ncbi:UNVERIFIED_CONTAM: hypothetical protein ABID98_005671 [Brevibacillus sp. OAP136]
MRAYLNLKKYELLRKVGSIKQVAGIEMISFMDGRAKGVQGFDVRNGRLRFTVLSDRALDIGQVEFDGIPFAWLSPVGYSSGYFYEPEADGWQRNFSGGLLTTCGLTQVGEPCVDGSEQLGLHGRISNTPASQVAYEENWDGETLVLSVKGKVGQTVLFGENLEMHRTITTRYGAQTIQIHDRVINQGFQPAPLLFLYHINLGFPLVDEHSYLVCSAGNVTAWEGTPAANLEKFDKIPPPDQNVNEEVIHVDVQPAEDQYCYALLVNPNEELAFFIKFRKRQFPRFSIWKGIREGVYCLGFEPSNCGLNGRLHEKENGQLEWLAPFAERHFEAEFGFLQSTAAIQKFIEVTFGGPA